MSVRLERLKSQIKEDTAQLILHKLNDPRVGFCTVTRVELAQDLSTAVIYISVFGDEAAKRNTMRGLQHARGLIQNRIAKHLKTRVTPEVHLRLDESIERAYRISTKIREARASDRDGGLSTRPAPAEELADEAETEKSGEPEAKKDTARPGELEDDEELDDEDEEEPDEEDELDEDGKDEAGKHGK